MSLKLHSLKIKKKVFLTNEAVALYIDIPFELKETYSYRQGQFIAVQVKINGDIYRREYSICSSPYYENEFVIACKVVNNGIVSGYLFNQIREGDSIDTYPPAGKFFTELFPENKKEYVLIAGGSGITPVLSILKSVLYVEPESSIILYYGNLNEESIMFRNDIDDLHDTNKHRFKLYYSLTDFTENWKGFKGLINTSDLGKILISDGQDYESEREYFICGPEEMMILVKDFLLEKNTAPDKIHIEYFTAPQQHVEFTPVIEEYDESKERTVKVILDGDEHEVTVEPGISILNSVISADLDPPFSCKSGICTTCRAKLYSGKVRMDEREGLSDSEIEDGYILTCQSHPLTDDVKLEYM